MGHNRWYFTGILLSFLLLCLIVLGMRWRVLAQRVPLEAGSLAVVQDLEPESLVSQSGADNVRKARQDEEPAEPLALANLEPEAGTEAEKQAASTDPASPAGKIDINSANAARLDELPGIGPKLAQAIVEHRRAHGPFKSIEDLLDVPGIGESKLAAMRDMLSLGAER